LLVVIDLIASELFAGLLNLLLADRLGASNFSIPMIAAGAAFNKCSD
jgi:hypothetical protein